MNAHPANNDEPAPTLDLEKSVANAHKSTKPEDHATQALNDTQALQPANDTAGFELATTDHSPTDAIGATQSFEHSSHQPTVGPQKISVAGYDLLGELGRGAMGVVYKARHQRADRIVALKVLINSAHAQPKEIERFEIEAKASARLQHPNIVQVYDVGQTGDLPYFTQEFVAGGTLARRIARESLSHEQAARMMLTLAQAVAYAHSRGIVHRDLKPANILMVDNDTPKIADFGLARRMEDESHLTKDGTIIGTPAYMPPEQAYGSAEEIGPHSDVYTLGAILYELLVGRPPFKGATVWEVIEQVRTAEPVRPSEIERRVPRDLETICLKCLNKDPSKRYESAQALADDLERYINLQPILARPIGRVERFVRLVRRHPTESGLIGLVALLLLLTSVGSVWTAIRISRDRDRIQREQELSKNRLKSRNDTIFQIVNRVPQKLTNIPFERAISDDLMQLTQEVLEADAENSKDDSAADSSRKWGLAGTAIAQGNLAQRAYFNKTSTNVSKEEREKQFEEVDNHYQTAYRLTKEVYDSGQGDRAKAKGNLALVLNTQAGFYAKTKQGPDPLALIKQAIELRKAAVDEPIAEDPLSKRRGALARTQSDFVEMQFARLEEMSDPVERQKLAAELAEVAQSACNSLQEILNDQALSDDQTQTSKRDLALVAANLARCAEVMNDNVLAEQSHQICVNQLQDLIKVMPELFSLKLTLLNAANSFGDFLLTRKQDFVKARAQYVTAMTIVRDLKKDRVLTQLEDTWMREYYRLGMAAYASKNAEQTQRYFARAELICDMRLREMEDVKASVDAPDVWQQRCVLMLIHAWSGKVEQAATMARRIQQRFADDQQAASRPLRLADAAFALGLAALAVPENRRPAAQHEALELMRDAIKAGFKDAQYLRLDPDVSGLRAIPEFETIIQSLEH